MTGQRTAAIAAALRDKYPTPQAALAALGLDAALLDGSNKEATMTKITPDAARAIVDKLKAAGKLAFDADPGAVVELLRDVEGLDGTDPNAGIPAFLAEHPEDADDAFETAEERLADEGYDRRAIDARKRLGRDETEEEALRREEELEHKPDADKATDRRRAMDAIRARRAADARRKLGRDETAEELKAREEREEAEDRRRAADRIRLGRDSRRARDAHRRALDAMKRHADDWKRACDAYKAAEDAHRKATDAKDEGAAAKAAEDRRKAADARSRAADAIRAAHDARVKARDARRKALDARRKAHDEPADFQGMPEPGGEMVSKTAMDAAIEAALQKNDARHREIAAAVEHVRPKVGAIAMDSSIKSDGDVYRRALTVLGIACDGITEVPALKRIFEMAQKPGSERSGSAGTIAMDSKVGGDAASAGKFREMFPGAAGILHG